MPGTTATQGLIYPIGTDRLCDGALQIEVLAKGMNARYVALDEAVDAAHVPAMVLIEWVGETESEDALSITSINWNTVQIDDAEAYDAALSPTLIQLPYSAPGDLWEVGMYAEAQWSSVFGGVEQATGIFAEITSDTGVQQWIWDANGPAVRPVNSNSAGISLVLLHETTSRDLIRMTFSTANPDLALEYAQLWAIRVSEA